MDHFGFIVRLFLHFPVLGIYHLLYRMEFMYSIMD